jgi:hypothetical protein
MSDNETPKEEMTETRPYHLVRREDDDDGPTAPSPTGWRYSPTLEARRAEPATGPQRYFLERRGKWRDGITLGEAYDLIKRLKDEEGRQAQAVRRRSRLE